MLQQELLFVSKVAAERLVDSMSLYMAFLTVELIEMVLIGQHLPYSEGAMEAAAFSKKSRMTISRSNFYFARQSYYVEKYAENFLIYYDQISMKFSSHVRSGVRIVTIAF